MTVALCKNTCLQETSSGWNLGSRTAKYNDHVALICNLCFVGSFYLESSVVWS